MATVSEAVTAAPEPPPTRFSHSLRWRLTLFYVVLLAGGALFLLLFVNTAAQVVLSPLQIEVPPYTGNLEIDREAIRAAQEQARSETLNKLHAFSLLGFIAIVGGGFAGGAYVAGRALEPLGEMSRVARRISSSNLQERIALDGPDDELKQLADAFDDMVARLDNAFQQQSQFIADASHELRTPLTALQLSVDAVRADPAASMEDYRRVVDETATSTKRMRRLVEDLLALAATERQAMPLGRVALAPLAEAVVDELEPLARQENVTLSTTVPHGSIANGDTLALRRALTNLVENALRYNRPQGTVTVEGAPAPPGYVGLAVTDTGTGISSEAQPQVFNRFYRVDQSRSRDGGGSGLGLSIVARIAQAHGGTVMLDSRLGEGSRFTLILPGEPAVPRAE